MGISFSKLLKIAVMHQGGNAFQLSTDGNPKGGKYVAGSMEFVQNDISSDAADERNMGEHIKFKAKKQISTCSLLVKTNGDADTVAIAFSEVAYRYLEASTHGGGVLPFTNSDAIIGKGGKSHELDAADPDVKSKDRNLADKSFKDYFGAAVLQLDPDSLESIKKEILAEQGLPPGSEKQRSDCFDHFFKAASAKAYANANGNTGPTTFEQHFEN